MLKVKDLHAYYGSIEALRGIDLEVSDKSIVCLIGSNGAGKTTLLKSISGMVAHTGRIEWDSEISETTARCRLPGAACCMSQRDGMFFPGLRYRKTLRSVV